MMVVGEGWIVVVVGGFVFTDVVCVDLVLVVVVASVVRFLQFFLLQVVMPVAAVVAFVIVVVSVLVAVAPSAAHCCGLLRSLPHLLRLFCFPVPASSRFVPAGVCCRGGPLRPCLVVAVYHGRSPPSQDTRGCLHAIYFSPFAKRTVQPCFRSDRTLPAHGGIDQTVTFSPARSPRPSP